MPPKRKKTTKAAPFGKVYSTKTKTSSTTPASPEPALPQQPQRTRKTIVENGDILIIPTVPAKLVGQEEEEEERHVEYLVSSHILCAASSVWRAMLGPDSRFAEATQLRQGLTPVAITLEEAPEILELVMLALHHKNFQLPERVSFCQIADLAEVADKYYLKEALWYVGSEWASQWESKAMEPGYEDFLLVAGIFGFDDVFTSLSRQMVMRGCILDGEFVVGKLCRELTPSMPEAVISDMIARRNKVLQSLKTLLEKYGKDVNRAGVRCQQVGKNQDACDMLQRGQFATLAQGLHTDDDEELESTSLISLRNTVCGTKVATILTDEVDHTSCSFLPALRRDFVKSFNAVEGLDYRKYPSLHQLDPL